MKESPIEFHRAAVHDVLDARFGPETAAQFDEALQRLNDLEELTRLLREAARCRLPAEFQRLLRT